MNDDVLKFVTAVELVRVIGSTSKLLAVSWAATNSPGTARTGRRSALIRPDGHVAWATEDPAAPRPNPW
ncbi:hypothetical protein [Saccharopolyspora sp. NPDC050642]|uniref:aromatic-ring hydroxylase C-terminal domain-containing protein n=1 Tax=Saccharopolyspora sp. NPDC050642 TaxID=3157099 RepID=UPI0033F4A239